MQAGSSGSMTTTPFGPMRASRIFASRSWTVAVAPSRSSVRPRVATIFWALSPPPPRARARGPPRAGTSGARSAGRTRGRNGRCSPPRGATRRRSAPARARGPPQPPMMRAASPGVSTTTTTSATCWYSRSRWARAPRRRLGWNPSVLASRSPIVTCWASGEAGAGAGAGSARHPARRRARPAGAAKTSSSCATSAGAARSAIAIPAARARRGPRGRESVRVAVGLVMALAGYGGRAGELARGRLGDPVSEVVRGPIRDGGGGRRPFGIRSPRCRIWTGHSSYTSPSGRVHAVPRGAATLAIPLGRAPAGRPADPGARVSAFGRPG
jgi:hypothetical protein